MEKRAQKRIRKRLSVRFGEVELVHAGFTRDISPAGVFVVCNAVPAVGTRLRLEFMAGPERWITRSGIVRRVRQVPQALRHVEQMGFGLAFVPSVQDAPLPGATAPDPLLAEPEVLEVRFVGPDALHGTWQRELKVGGMVLTAERPVQLNQRVQVRMRLDFARVALELPARVVQLLAGPTRQVAVAFEDLPGMRRALAPYLAAG